MVTDASPQRAYRAACPNCGAPVEFRSLSSAFAVCSFCRSTLVREGDALRRIGESAELFDDHSPLQLGAAGRYQGAPFTLVGRLQYRYADGTWNEWHALFDGAAGAKSGWLSEDNGRHVIAFDLPLAQAVTPPERLVAGTQLQVAGEAWSVASVTTVKLGAAQGELPVRPVLERAFVVADLRSARGEVGTLEYSDPAAPRWSVGRSVALSELAMTGLADSAEKTLKGRSFACPNCGAALDIKLETTRSIVCAQCKSVVSLGESGGQGADAGAGAGQIENMGVGANLQHYAQQNGSEPQIPLGSIGIFAFGSRPSLSWQVVGYVERCTVPTVDGAHGPDGNADADGDNDADADEQTFWREYLLYHRSEGFTFLIDADDGWSWSAPITGVPERFGDSVKYEGVLYRRLYRYTGRVTYALGEFYWRLTRDQSTRNTDYRGTGAASAKRLNREQTGAADSGEIVWSAGETLRADAVLQAFRLAPSKSAALQRDALPTSGSSALLKQVLFWLVVVVFIVMLVRCDDDSGTGNGSGTRTSGGSYGGFSSGGGHK